MTHKNSWAPQPREVHSAIWENVMYWKSRWAVDEGCRMWPPKSWELGVSDLLRMS